MRTPCATLLLALALLVGAVPAPADQTDPRLDELFDALGNATDRLAAHQVEQEIWTIWFESPDPAATAALDAAREAAEAGAVQEALERFDRLVDNHPRYAEGWNQRAIMRYLVGDLDGSMADIEATLELEPRHFGALSGRGQCLLRMERYADALDAFEDALSINPWIQSTARQIEMLKAIVNQRRQSI
ncbi:MAG: tetratricopeptide repeat protein [Gammaproteobacteria bacterium]